MLGGGFIYCLVCDVPDSRGYKSPFAGAMFRLPSGFHWCISTISARSNTTFVCTGGLFTEGQVRANTCHFTDRCCLILRSRLSCIPARRPMWDTTLWTGWKNKGRSGLPTGLRYFSGALPSVRISSAVPDRSNCKPFLLGIQLLNHKQIKMSSIIFFIFCKFFLFLQVFSK